MIGETISHYKILEKLGEGGMGVVYKALDTKLDRLVALKFLPSHLSTSEQDKARFIQEAKAASAINHPNICTIYAIDEHDGQLFIAMEFVDGQTLKDRIAHKGEVTSPLPMKQAIEIGIQIAGGLAAAHEKGIVHRDVKSANIMLTEGGQVKIMDFGLAKVTGGTQVTKIGTTVGTAAYMSPEQASGDGVNHRSDIWSFGIVLYEMLLGQLPFKSDYEQAVIYSILNEDPAIPGTLPDNLKQVLAKTLAKNPADRFQHMGDVLVALKKGERTESAADISGAKQHPTNISRRRLLRGSGVGIAVVVAVAAVLFFASKTPMETEKKSIAVLPFENLSADPENEYFSDGITEDIITQLSKIVDLKVISRTSVMKYKGMTRNLREIAKELGVATILEGSVRRSGERVRIVGQLIHAETDAHIWAETYDREMKDIFAIQTDVAIRIAGALQATLSPDERKRIERQSTGNTDAYQLYLQGRFFWNKRSNENVNKSIGLFRQAIGKDSTYALAYAGLGDAYLIHGVYGRRPPEESFPLAKSYIEKALQLDNTLAEAYASLGDINIHYSWNLDAAEANLHKAIALNPQYASGHHWYSEALVLRGKFEEAYRASKHALELDPYSSIINTQLGEHYRRGGEYDKAIGQIKKTIEFDSTFAYAYHDLGVAYITVGQFDQALRSLRKANSLAQHDTRIEAALGYAESLAGNKTDATRMYRLLLDRAGLQYVSPFDLSVAALGAGKNGEALTLFERALRERGPWVPFAGLNPLFRPLWDVPEFQQMVQQILPQD